MENVSSFTHSHSFIQTWEGTVVVTGRRAKPLWLDGIKLPPSGSGVVSFEARGSSDIDVLFASYPEKVSEDEQVESEENSHRADYEVVIGSHCNTRSVIRKRGVLRATSMVGVGKESSDSSIIGSRSQHQYTSWEFERYWIGINQGLLAVGKGDLGSDVFLCWKDPFPVKEALSVGISSWNRPVVFRFIEMTPMPDGLVCSNREEWSNIYDLFLTSLHRFHGFFCDTCFESSDGALFPFHGCLISALSSRLAAAIKETHSYQMYNGGSDNIVHREPSVFLLSTIDSNCLLISQRDFERLPRVTLSASTVAVAMFLQLLYGVGLDGRSFHEMRSMQSRLQISGAAHQVVEECNELLNQWELPYLSLFESSFSNDFQDQSSAKLYEEWKQHLLQLVPSHLKFLRETSWLSDINLVVSDWEEMSHVTRHENATHFENNSGSQQVTVIPAHRIILACRCSYFQKMLLSGMRETFEKDIELKDASGVSVERLLRNLYLEQVENNEETCRSCWQTYLSDLKTGDMFYNTEFVRIAVTKLKKIVDKWNAAVLMNLSLKYCIYDLFQVASSFICSHFMEVVECSDSLLDLEDECLISILSRIDLIVKSEDDVLNLVIKWLEQQNYTNSMTSRDILSMVRWPFVSADWKAKLELQYGQLFDLIRGRITKVKEKVLNLHYSLPDGQEDSFLERSYSDSNCDTGFSEIFEQPRIFDLGNIEAITIFPCKWIPPRFFIYEEREKWKRLRTDWTFMCNHIPRMKNGEVWIPFIPTQVSLGVLFYLSCHSGNQLIGTRLNPHKHGMVKVSSSSGSRFSRLESLVDSSANRSSFALPDNSGFAWFSLDLGTKYELACSSYSLVHDGSESNFLRSWYLQGSTDGLQWSTLKEHVNDKNLQHPLQRCVWKIDNIISQEFFRHFRVILKCQGSKLNLGNFEFYGRLRIQ